MPCWHCTPACCPCRICEHHRDAHRGINHTAAGRASKGVACTAKCTGIRGSAIARSRHRAACRGRCLSLSVSQHSCAHEEDGAGWQGTERGREVFGCGLRCSNFATRLAETLEAGTAAILRCCPPVSRVSTAAATHHTRTCDTGRCAWHRLPGIRRPSQLGSCFRPRAAHCMPGF